MGRIVYVQGHESSGTKVRVLEEYFGTVLVPEIPSDPHKAVKNIIRALDEAGPQSILVGSSFGGLYADFLNATLDIPAVLINPLTETSMVGNKKLPHCKKLNEMIQTSRYSPETRIAPEFVILAEDDEVLPVKITKRNLIKSDFTERKIFTFTEGGHRFSDHTHLVDVVSLMLDLTETMDFRGVHSTGMKLNERFVTLAPDNDAEKEKLLPLIAPQINGAYAKIGGFLDTPDITTSQKVMDKLTKNTLWKLVRRNGEIVAGVIYSMKRGRKGICCWTNNTVEGKDDLAKIVREDEKFKRAWIEVSDSAERFYQKHSGGSPLPREQAELVLDSVGKKAIKWHDDGYHYDREIQGEVHTKCIYGTAQ